MVRWSSVAPEEGWNDVKTSTRLLYAVLVLSYFLHAEEALESKVLCRPS